jgi:hypothetical protein
MCQSCDSLTVEAGVELLLASATRDLILAQTDTGESVPHATRPLSAAEKRAKMRFGEIDKLESAAAEKAAKLLTSNAQVYIMAVIGAIFGTAAALEPDQAVEAFDQLARGEMPPEAAAAADTITGNMAQILAAVFAGGSLIALGEARRQGGKNLPDPLEAKPDRFRPLARAVALHPWTRITSKLQTDLLTPAGLSAPLTKEAVTTAAKAIPLDGAEDLARQTIHTAHGQGRAETQVILQPAEIEASELLDGETCDRCSAVDGKVYASMAEALVEYEQGYYGACRGGARCRGTLVTIYGYGG